MLDKTGREYFESIDWEDRCKECKSHPVWLAYWNLWDSLLVFSEAGLAVPRIIRVAILLCEAILADEIPLEDIGALENLTDNLHVRYKVPEKLMHLLYKGDPQNTRNKDDLKQLLSELKEFNKEECLQSPLSYRDGSSHDR